MVDLDYVLVSINFSLLYIYEETIALLLSL
jgi:hypothetical protein